MEKNLIYAGYEVKDHCMQKKLIGEQLYLDDEFKIQDEILSFKNGSEGVLYGNVQSCELTIKMGLSAYLKETYRKFGFISINDFIDGHCWDEKYKTFDKELFKKELYKHSYHLYGWKNDISDKLIIRCRCHKGSLVYFITTDEPLIRIEDK